MIELKFDSLVVSLPDLPENPTLTIDFQRTVRIPDDGKDYPLPPGFRSFPLRHIDDYARTLPKTWLKRGGVLLPMWQSEALWLGFTSTFLSDRDTNYPFAVKVATGKVSAITGQPWRPGLIRKPQDQDYLIVPQQRWLDGYCVEKGIIRQFVAVPLGEGYSVEEQLTGEAEVGGIQVEVFPMRHEAFDKHFPIRPPRVYSGLRRRCRPMKCTKAGPCGAMEMAQGGRMTQEIYKDPFSFQDWETNNPSRCFIHLLNSATWRQITGEPPPSQPLTPEAYTFAGYPWFDYYDADQEALNGSKTLAGVKTVTQIRKKKGIAPLPDNRSVSVTNIDKLRAGLTPHQVREADFD